MWLRCVSILLCIIMLKCVSSHLAFQIFCSNLIQMWLRFILVSSVLHHIKMCLHQFSSHFSLHLQFFLISSCFFSLFCKSLILKRKVTIMMSNHQLNLKYIIDVLNNFNSKTITTHASQILKKSIINKIK